jgi:hypothetical protein
MDQIRSPALDTEYSPRLLAGNSFWLCAGIPGVTKEAVNYVHERLLLDLSNEEAAARYRTITTFLSHSERCKNCM